MKLKKDNVRKDILEASKQEFFINGYKEANMRSIAERAHITPGNIYRYYASKEDLFDAVVGKINKTISSVTRLETMIPQSALLTSKNMIDFFISFALDSIIKYKYETIILLSRSKGSKYEKSVETFVEFTAQSIDKTREKSNIDLSEILARSVVRTEIDILEKYIDDEDKMKNLSLEFLNTVFASFNQSRYRIVYNNA